MPVFHRFCSFFPAFLATCLCIILLSGCVANTAKPVWDSSAQSKPSTTPPNTSYPISNLGYANNPATASTKVAILLPLSGSKSSIGQSMLQAAQLAVFDTGYDSFELVPIDTQGTAQGAAAAAAQALSGGAQIILGPLFAEEVRAVKTATSGHNINILAFSTDWTLAGGNTFIMGFLPFGQIDRVIDFAARKGLKNTAIVTSYDTYGTAAAGAYETSARAKGMTTTRTNNITPPIDSVFIPAGGQDLNTILSKISPSTAKKLGTGLWDDPRVTANPVMNGAWFAAPAPSLHSIFESKYQSSFGTTPIRVSSLAYDATALCVALAKLGSSQGTGPAFNYNNLTNPNGFAGIDGIMRFNKNGMAERGLSIMEIQNGRMVEIDPAPKRF